MTTNDILPEIAFNTPADNLAELRLMIELSRTLLDRMERRISALEKEVAQQQQAEGSDRAVEMFAE
jgi:hypothetical protein